MEGKAKQDALAVTSEKELEFIKELGEGAFGKVKVAIIKDHGEGAFQYAVKMCKKKRIIKSMGSEELYNTMRDREVRVSDLVFDIEGCIKFFRHMENDVKDFFFYEVCKGGNLGELK